MAHLPLHPVHRRTSIDQFDVCIAGSGPVGALFARQLVDNGYNVVMIEIGEQDTRVPGAHKKNEIKFQKDRDRFVRVIQGALSTVSIPISRSVVPTLDPAVWTAKDPVMRCITNGRNPFQEEHNNLGAQAVTRGVGGMSTHWTCATPEFLKRDSKGKVFERPVIYQDVADDDAEWSLLYNAARSIIGTSTTEFEHSIRHNVVLNKLKESYPDRNVQPLPLACHRLADGSPYIQWHAADNILGDMFKNKTKKNAKGVDRGNFSLLANTRCTKLHLKSDSSPNSSVGFAEVKDLLADRFIAGEGDVTDYAISAKIFVVASGAVATPQILANSGFGGCRDQVGKEDQQLIPNLGRYITEQPLSFCQVVLRQDLVNDVANPVGKPDWWVKVVKDHQTAYPKDPCPIPVQDGEPQVTIPASYERPWHSQIHRDAFSYGETGPTVDGRVVVDLRFFGRQTGDINNKIIFENTITDGYGMPQPTFIYEPTTEFANETSKMMNDMTDVANKLGGYLPGSNPQFMTPGLALHLAGTTRLGRGDEQNESVADYNSQVWKFDNLYVGGNGLIPTAFGANPTLTSMCLAFRAAYKIHRDLTVGTLTSPDPTADLEKTPPEWVNWTKDGNDPNFPDHKHLRALHLEI